MALKFPNLISLPGKCLHRPYPGKIFLGNRVHLGGFLAYDFAYGGDYEFDKAFDAGIQVGVGAWFSRFNLDFTYQAGFCNTLESSDKDFCKIGKFMIRVGYAF